MILKKGLRPVGMLGYASLMTTTTLDPSLTLLALADSLPAARVAQFASKIAAARQGTLSSAHAMMIIRQLGGMSSPAQGEDKIERPRSTGSASTHRSDDASEAQARYAADLLRTRVMPGERVPGTAKTAPELLALFEAAGRMSRAIARSVIDSYKDRPRVTETLPKVASLPASPAATAGPTVVDAVVTEPGIYQCGDDVYKVQKSRQSGRLYAQKLVDGRFDYDAGWGAMKFLRASHRMTTEQAAAFGQRFGMCVNGHPLSDRTSRYFGYGESCASRNGWTYDKGLVPADFE